VIPKELATTATVPNGATTAVVTTRALVMTTDSAITGKDMRRLFLTEKRRIEISHHDVGAAMESEIGAETIEHYPQLAEKALYRLPLHAHPSRTLGLAINQYKKPHRGKAAAR